MQSAPVRIRERSDILDVLRGIALFGIIIANAGVLCGYVFLPADQKATIPTYHIDKVLSFLLTAFVQGKFYSLFSLLFGIGFTIILERNIAAGRNPLKIFYRRLMVLMLIGLAHLLMVWDGDILLLYALIGMLLLLFRKLSDGVLIRTAIFLILSPLIFDLIVVLTKGEFQPGAWFKSQAIKVDTSNGITEQNFTTYLSKNKSYDAVLNWNQGGFFWRFEMLISSNRIPKVLAMFLIGLVVGRRHIYSKPEENKKLLATICKWGFIVGIPASLAFAFFSIDKWRLPAVEGMTDTLAYAVSVIPLSLAYTTGICLLWMNSKNFLKLFAAPGRMALTNYVTQSVVGIYIYYGFGLGLIFKTGPSGYLTIALLVYVCQVIFSHFWLRYFNFGPLEWLWRILTYGRYFPLKRSRTEKVIVAEISQSA